MFLPPVRLFWHAALLFQKTPRLFGVFGNRAKGFVDNMEVFADNIDVFGILFGVFDKNLEKIAKNVNVSGRHVKVFDNFLDKNVKPSKVFGATADKINDTLVCPSCPQEKTMSSTVPVKVSEYIVWLANFNTVAGNNQATLGLSASDLTALAASASSVNNAINTVATAAASLKSAHLSKKNTVKSSETLLRGYVKTIAASKTVPDTLKKQLGINARQPNTHTPPAIPKTLAASVLKNGTPTLSWKANGNISPTIYMVEIQMGGSSTWTLLDSTMRTKYVVADATPGVKTAFRIYAKRNDVVSGYSNIAVVYGG